MVDHFGDRLVEQIRKIKSFLCLGIDPHIDLIPEIFDKSDLQKLNVLRRIIAPMGTMDAIEFISSKLKDTKNNSDFFNSMNKPT